MPRRAPTSEPEPLLVFEEDGRRYGLPLSAVSGISDVGPIRPVAGAHKPILGLAEWRGRVLTVLDLPELLGLPSRAPASSVVRLAPPIEHIGLRLPEGARLGSRDDGDGTESVQKVDPLRLLRPWLSGRGR